jgi:hypothetical protein
MDLSQLPEIPSTWLWAPMSSVAESVLGKMLDKGKNRGELLPYLRNLNVRWGKFDLSDVKLMRFEEHERDRFGLRNGDVLVCEGGEPGRAAVWRDEWPGMHFQKALHRVRCGELVSPDWLVMAIRFHAETGRLSEYFTGSGIAHLTGVSLARVPIPLPPLEEQMEIVRFAQILDSVADAVEARIANASHQVTAGTNAVLAQVFGADALVAQETGAEQMVRFDPEVTTMDTSSTSDSTSRNALVDLQKNDGSTEAVRAIIRDLPAGRYTFNELRQITSINYENFQAVLFALLAEKEPIIRQVFDPEGGAMVYARQPK